MVFWLQVVAAFGVVLLVHEFAHFLGAKITGIPVRVFHAGFWPIVWRKVIWGTEFRFSPLPVASFVDVVGKSGDRSKELSSISKLRDSEWTESDRAALCREENWYSNRDGLSQSVVVGLGLLANFLFIVPLWFVLLAGRGEAEQADSSAVAMTGKSLASPFRAAGYLLQGKHPKEALNGPDGILTVGRNYAGQGVYTIVAYMIVITSIVSVLNLCPLPPFDGGEFVLACYKAVTGSDPPSLALVAMKAAGVLAVIGIAVIAFT